MTEDWRDDPFVDPDDPAAIERAERRAEREAKRSKRDAKKREKEASKAPPPAPEPPKPQRTPEQEFWNDDPEPAPAPPASGKATDGTAPADGSPGEAKGAGPSKTGEPAAAKGPTSKRADGAAPAEPEEVPTGGGDVPKPGDGSKDTAAAVPDEPVPGAPRTGEGKLPPPLPLEDPTVEAPKPGKRFRRRRRIAGAGAVATGGAAAAAGASAAGDADAAAAAGGPAGAGAASGAPNHDDAPMATTSTSADPTPKEPEAGGAPTPDGPRTGEHPLTGEHPAAGAPPATGEYAPLTSQHELPSDEWDAQPAREEIWDDEGDPDMTAAGRGRGGRRGRDASGGGFWAALKRHPFRAAGLVILFIVLWFVYALFQPFHSGGHGKVQVKIPKGASVSEVGDILLDKDVIQSPIFPVSGSTMFQIRATIDGKRSELYAGNFTLEEDMSYGDALDALSVPPVKRVISVTVPEGYTRAQAGQIVKEDGVPGNYVKKTVKSKYLDPADYGGKDAKNLEGFLFPNTFELKPKAPVSDLVELQLKDFKRQIKKVDMSYAKSKNLTVYDVLIIASMIEREAGVPKQRKQVAAVVYNRLKEGMPLGIDATIRFAVNNYDKPLTESELATDSPYNTRTNVGLPPGPINSPGLAAIQAAAHPAKSDYIFYVNKPNTCGELSFSENETEFEEDVAAYEKAREANGGNEPSSC